MPIDFSAELPFMLGDAGEAITIAGKAGFGIVDVVGELVLPDGGAPVVGAKWHVVVRSGEFPGLKERAAVTARGSSWTARSVLPVADGLETEFYLLEA
jgi:hypothetical protein